MVSHPSLIKHLLASVVVTCFGVTRIAEATIVAQLAIEIAILLHGRGIGQEHAQHGNVLVVILGLLDPLGANGLGLQVEARLHPRAEHIHVGHVRGLLFSISLD